MLSTSWEKAVVGPDVPLRDAIATLDAARLGLVLVVDKSRHLLGTVTDGDVRRAILRRTDLDSPVREVMCRTFFSVRQDARREDSLRLMQANVLRHLPILDPEGRLIGLHLIQDFLEARELPNRVIIMAGGRGTRLAPLTDNVPKPMLPVGGQPILEVFIRRLVRQGFRRVTICVYYLGDMIRAHFGDGSAFGCAIDYIEEPAPLGTGGALSLLRERPNETFVVANADLVTDADLASLVQYHVEHRFAATMCVREHQYQVPYGVVDIDGLTILNMEEKPVKSVFINAGIYALEPAVLDLLTQGERFELPNLFDRARSHGFEVGAFPIREAWVDVGQRDVYETVKRAATSERRGA